MISVLRRYHRDGFLRVDGGERVTGQSRGSLRTLDVGELTYLGGVEAADDDKGGDEKLRSRVGTSAGFVGCLREFKLGRRPVALHSDHDPTVMVRVCLFVAHSPNWGIERLLEPSFNLMIGYLSTLAEDVLWRETRQQKVNLIA